MSCKEKIEALQAHYKHSTLPMAYRKLIGRVIAVHDFELDKLQDDKSIKYCRESGWFVHMFGTWQPAKIMTYVYEGNNSIWCLFELRQIETYAVYCEVLLGRDGIFIANTKALVHKINPEPRWQSYFFKLIE